MGSKKLKKKKIKLKKLEKLRNLRKNNCKKTNLDFAKELNFEKTLRQKNDFDRFLVNKKYSRSCIEESYVSKVKYFSEIREHYFNYLRRVVSGNCLYYGFPLSEDVFLNLSLQLEQHAILACLQADIYEKAILKIISDIEKCSEIKQLHEEVKRLIPDSPQSEVVDIKTEDMTNNLPTAETYSQIPTISSTRTDDNLNVNEWTEQEMYNPEIVDLTYTEPHSSILNPEVHSSSQIDTNLSTWDCSDSYAKTGENSNYWNGECEIQQANDSGFSNIENCFENTPNSNLVQITSNVNDQEEKAKPISIFSQIEVETKKIDPLLLASRNQLQKSVEKTLNETEKVKKQKKDEKERAYIAHILEGYDSLDDKFYDSLSDNENDSKENVDETNLVDRLEKMRELFGMEEEENQIVVEEKPKMPREKPLNTQKRRNTIWKHEKIIQLHKFSMLASEMSFEKRHKIRRRFSELFGEDSDEEHVVEYCCQERYRVSCTERISSWVVKYLMPFYHQKRIIGRNVFKSLGHHISDTIVDKIQYPDEWTVKYFVSKFFPPKKKYVCEADVIAFEID